MTTREPTNTRGRTVLLIAVLVAVFVVPLSVSGTAVALADIAQSLGASPVGQQWALNGFNITFAASTLAWGSLADRIGRHLSFQLGAVIFVAGSAVSVIAQSYLVLDIARIIAGLGAGAVFSVGSALLSVVYSDAGRARVFSLLGATAGLALAFGPTVCGIVAQSLSWRAIFAFQGSLLVLSLVLMLATRALLRGEPRLETPFDWPAALLFFVFTAGLVSALVTGSDAGWNSPTVLGLVLLALAAATTLTWHERRTAHPLLDFGLIRQARFLGVTLVVAVASFTFAAVVTYMPALVQDIYELSPATSGMFVMFMTLPTLVAPLIAGALVARGIRARHALTTSLLLMVAGSGLIALGVSTTIWLVIPAMVLLGAGFGTHAGLVDNEGLAVAPDHNAGMAAGWINTMRVGTEAIAVSLFGAVFIPALSSGGASSAFSLVTAGSTGLALVITIIAIRAMNRKTS